MDTAPEIRNELSLVQIKRKESVIQNSLSFFRNEHLLSMKREQRNHVNFTLPSSA